MLTQPGTCTVGCSAQHKTDKKGSLHKYGVFIRKSQEMGGASTIIGPASERALVTIALVAVVYKRCPGRARNSFAILLRFLARFPTLTSGELQRAPWHMSGAVGLVAVEM